jgi:acetyl-CoA carboxylase beta subunit
VEGPVAGGVAAAFFMVGHASIADEPAVTAPLPRPIHAFTP